MSGDWLESAERLRGEIKNAADQLQPGFTFVLAAGCLLAAWFEPGPSPAYAALGWMLVGGGIRSRWAREQLVFLASDADTRGKLNVSAERSVERFMNRAGLVSAVVLVALIGFALARRAGLF